MLDWLSVRLGRSRPLEAIGGSSNKINKGWVPSCRDQVSCGEVADEAHLGIGTKACAEQVANLGDDKLRDDQRARMGLQEIEALVVVGVVAVDVGV